MAALERARAILGGESLEGVANCADYIKGRRRYTARCHYIDIPLDASAIDLERDCPQGACTLAKTEHFWQYYRTRGPNSQPRQKL